MTHPPLNLDSHPPPLRTVFLAYLELGGSYYWSRSKESWATPPSSQSQLERPLLQDLLGQIWTWTPGWTGRPFFVSRGTRESAGGPSSWDPSSMRCRRQRTAALCEKTPIRPLMALLGTLREGSGATNCAGHHTLLGS